MAEHITLAAICPACIPLWFIAIIATGVVLFPFLENWVGNHEKWAPYIKIARFTVYVTLIKALPLLLIGGASLLLPWEQTPTTGESNTINSHCAKHIAQEEPSNCCTTASINDSEKTSNYGLYAIGSDTENAISYCYALNTDTGEHISFEVPYVLSTTDALHLYREESSTIAVLKGKDSTFDLYTVDTNSIEPKFEFIGFLLSDLLNAEDFLFEEIGTLELPETWSKYLQESWEVISKPLNDPQSGTLFLSIFDREKKANLLVTLDPESNRFLTLMETDLPIHAVGSIAQ